MKCPIESVMNCSYTEILKIRKNLLTKTFVPLIDALNDVFPKKWMGSFHSKKILLKLSKEELLNKLTIFQYIITIYFEEIFITNSENNAFTHLIKDLYVQISFTVNPKDFREIKMGSIKGCRTSWNYVEYSIRYSHSHLRNFRSFDHCFTEFCLGASPLTEYICTSFTAEQEKNDYIFFL